nr:hypothetical protein [Tanacetum cinerariifolium]
MGYYFYYPPENKIFVARNANEEHNKVVPIEVEPYNVKVLIRRSARIPRAPYRYGEATYILGIKIIRNRSKWLIALSQSAYLEKTLKKFRMENSKKGYTPMMEKPYYRKSQGAKTPSEDDTKSQTIYVFVLNGGAIDWKSAKQSTDAMSSTEAEYIVVEASMKAVWMRKFIDGLGDVVPSNKRPIEMICDNEPAIAIPNNPGILKGVRHFQRKYHYIREVI